MKRVKIVHEANISEMTGCTCNLVGEGIVNLCVVFSPFSENVAILNIGR